MTFCGRIKSYNPKQGYGFLDCPEAHLAYGRDVFIHKAQMGELLGRFVGPGTKLDPKTLKMNVGFSVEINKSGMPQARDVCRLDTSPGQSHLESNEQQVLAEPQHAEAEVNLPPHLLTTPPGAVNSSDQPPGELWLGPASTDEEAARRGYQGRGGTIRIPSNADGASEEAIPSPSSPPLLPPQISRGAGGSRKAGRAGDRHAGGPRRSGGASGNAPAESIFGGDGSPIDCRTESYESFDDDLVRKSTGKRGSPKQAGNSNSGVVSSLVESKKRGYKDPYFRQQQPQYTFEASSGTPFYQANGPPPPYGQVQATQPHSQPQSPMHTHTGSPTFTPSGPPVYIGHDQQSPSAVSHVTPYQMPAAGFLYPQQLAQVYSSPVPAYADPSQPMPQFLAFQQQQQLYGQQLTSLQQVHQALPVSPQSTSQYAPSSSSPPLTPLHLSVGPVSDGSGSPVPVPLTAGPPLPGMLLPLGSAVGISQDMQVVLALAGGIDPSTGVPMMPTADRPPGSPVVHPSSFRAHITHDDSDSDHGFGPPMPLAEALPPGMCCAGSLGVTSWSPGVLGVMGATS